MIIYHQNNIAAFAGNHVFYSPLQSFLLQRVSITSAAAAGGLFLKQPDLTGLVVGGAFFANPIG